MYRTFSISCSILAIVLVSVVLFLSADALPERTAPHEHRGRVIPRFPQESEAAEERPEERDAFEWMRLHDPATGRIPQGIRAAEQAYVAQVIERGRQSAAGSAGAPFADDHTWTPRGPGNVGGRTRALAIDRTNHDVMLAGAITGGMWRSTNLGGSWVRTTPVADLPSVTCLVQDPRAGHGNVWYYGTGEFRSNSNRFGNVYLIGDGIFSSTDSGKSWRHLPSTITATPNTLDGPFDYVNALAFDASNTAAAELYAACNGAIMRSLDGGGTWVPALGQFGRESGYTTVAVTPAGVVYAGIGSGGTLDGIFRSTDGLAWNRIVPPTWPDSIRRIVIALAPSNPNVLYVLAETSGSGLQVPGSYGFDEFYTLWKYTYLSGNGSGAGGRWEDRSLNLPHRESTPTYNGLNSYAMSLAVDPSDEHHVFLGGTCLYHSLRGFDTADTELWLGGYDASGQYIFDGNVHPDQHALVFDPVNPHGAYAACDGGMFATSNVNSAVPEWHPLVSGYVTGQFYSIGIDPETAASEFLIGGLQDNGTSFVESTDPEWIQVYGGDGSFCAVAPGARVFYVSSQNGVTYRINHPDDSTYSYTRIAPVGSGGFLFVNPFLLDPGDANFMFMAGGVNLWRCEDLSALPDGDFSRPTTGWERLDSSRATASISALGMSTALPAHRLYFGTTNGAVYRLDSADHSRHRPVRITPPSLPAGAYVNCIAVDPRNGDRALVVVTNYNINSLFLTTNAGASWSVVGGNLEENPDGTGRGPSCRWATFVPRGPATYALVGTTAGLFSTTQLDGAATVWTPEGLTTIGAARIDMIVGRASDGMVAVASWGSGAFTTTLPVAGVEAAATGGAALRIDACVPNPMHGSATVRFTTASSAPVRLALFDGTGREVRRLIDRPMEAGGHSVTLERSSLAAGVYYVRLQAGVATTSTRVVIE